MIDTSVVLALIAIISGGGTVFGGYLLHRVKRLELRVEKLTTANAALSAENTLLKAQKAALLKERKRLLAYIETLKARLNYSPTTPEAT